MQTTSVWYLAGGLPGCLLYMKNQNPVLTFKTNYPTGTNPISHKGQTWWCAGMCSLLIHGSRIRPSCVLVLAGLRTCSFMVSCGDPPPGLGGGAFPVAVAQSFVCHHCEDCPISFHEVGDITERKVPRLTRQVRD